MEIMLKTTTTMKETRKKTTNDDNNNNNNEGNKEENNKNNNGGDKKEENNNKGKNNATVLKVYMHCEGCANKVTKHLNSIKGNIFLTLLCFLHVFSDLGLHHCSAIHFSVVKIEQPCFCFKVLTR